MKLAIYHTTDLHGHVFPTNYVKDMNLGMLKIFSYIKNDRENYDDSLLLDGGDLVQGTVLTNFLTKSKFDNNPILELLERVNYDAYILGNHEFNYGLDYLYKSYDLVKDKLINSNIEGFKLGQTPYRIFEKAGLKICVFGATTSYIPNWEQDKNIENLKFLNPIELYAKYEKEMKEKSDMIIVLYHGGFEKSLEDNITPTEPLKGENQGSEFIETFDSIDLMLTGHQHRSFITEIKGVISSQPINNGVNFTKIVYDTDTKTFDYELIDVESLNQDIYPEFEEIFKDTNVELYEYLAKIIGNIDQEIEIKDHFDVRLNGHPCINLIHEVQMDAINADFSSTTLFDSAIGFKKDISIRDVLVNYPYPNTLKVLEVSGQDIKDVIEISSEYFIINDNGEIDLNPKFQKPKLRNYIYDFYYGLDYIVDLKRDLGDRVISMKKDGVDIDLDKKYRIILNNYRASNTSEYPPYEGKPLVEESPFDMSELMISYIQKKKNLKANFDKNFKFLK